MVPTNETELHLQAVIICAERTESMPKPDHQCENDNFLDHERNHKSLDAPESCSTR